MQNFFYGQEKDPPAQTGKNNSKARNNLTAKESGTTQSPEKHNGPSSPKG